MRLGFTIVVLAYSLIWAIKFCYEEGRALKVLSDELSYLDKLNTEKEFDLVIGGDSRSIHGLVPYIFVEQLNLESGYNFAFPSNSWSKRYLDFLYSKVRNDGIVLIPLTAQSLTRLDENVAYEKAYQRSFFDIIRSFLSVNYNLNQLIRFPETFRWHYPPIQYSYKVAKDGWIPISCSQKNNESLTGSYEAGYRNFKYYSGYLVDLESVIKKNLKERNIQTFIFWLHGEKSIQKIDQQQSGVPFSEIRSHLMDVGGQFVSIVTPEGSTCDGDHLEERSAKEISNELAEELWKQLRR